MLYLLLLSLYLYAANALSAGGTCCVAHTIETSCDAEKGDECIWLDNNDPLYNNGAGASQGIQCVSETWADCEENGVCPPPPPPNHVPPPVPPQFSCYFDACTASHIELNIAYVIDESGSVGKTNYLTSLDFVENMVKHDINDVSKISMLAFASGLDRMYHFTDSQTDQRAGALAALTAERNDYRGGSTCTATALREIANEFKYTEGISPSDKNIVFLMTDGYPNCGGDVCDEKDALDAAGIEVIVVGISSGFSASKVACLVDDDKDIKKVAKFDAKLFYLLESQLRSVVCPVVYESYLAMVGDILYDGLYDNSYVSVWLLVIGVMIVGLVYYYREFICEKNGKYEPLI